VTGACDAGPGHCITCSDEGTPMRVLALGGDAARCVDERGDRHEVAVELVGPVDVGDELLVHAGVAIRHTSAAT
jgi:hydrogenase maturation factor